jgi:hypothetical protein
MATNGPVQIQGCAYRISRLNADGTIVASSSAMVQDDRPLVKVTLKPEMADGVTITPISACGVPMISYKDCNRYKRWNVELTVGDWDPEQSELLGTGAVITAGGSAGRTFTDGELTLNSNLINSPADADFVADDVGRPVTDAGFTVASCTTTTASETVSTSSSLTEVLPGMHVTGTGIPNTTVVVTVTPGTGFTISKPATATGTVSLTLHRLPVGAFIAEVFSATEARFGPVDAVSFGTGSTLSITLGAQSSSTIGYSYPHLLLVDCPTGVSIEVWSKAIVRGTGFQGTTPYPSAGTAQIPGSAWIRTGIFRAYLWHGALGIENKEQQLMFTGWAIENPNFGTGPLNDWRVTGIPGTGTPIDTTACIAQFADFELPSPLQPGYQTLPV